MNSDRMNEVGVRDYKEAKEGLRKDRNYKRLVADFERRIDGSILAWFGAKDIVEPPLAMLAAHYVKGKIDNRKVDAELGLGTNAPRKEAVRRAITHFIYELEDEAADIEEEFFSVHEMSRWLERFDRCNKISAAFRRTAKGNECESYEDRRKDAVSVMIKAGGYSTHFLQGRIGLTVYDSAVVNGPSGDTLFRWEWERRITAFDWLCRSIATWQVGRGFSWAIESELSAAAQALGRPRRKHVNG